jgi:hypothetical protein
MVGGESSRRGARSAHGHTTKEIRHKRFSAAFCTNLVARLMAGPLLKDPAVVDEPVDSALYRLPNPELRLPAE